MAPKKLLEKPLISYILEKHRPLNLIDEVIIEHPFVYSLCNMEKNIKNYSYNINLYKLLMLQAGLYLTLDSSSYMRDKEICKLEKISNFKFLSNSQWPVVYPKINYGYFINGHLQASISYNTDIEKPEILKLDNAELEYPPHAGGNIHFDTLSINDFQRYEHESQEATICDTSNSICFREKYFTVRDFEKLNISAPIFLSAFKVERVHGVKAIANFNEWLPLGNNFPRFKVIPEIFIIYAASQMIEVLLKGLNHKTPFYLSEVLEFKFEKIIYTPSNILFSLQELTHLPRYIKATVKVIINDEEVSQGTLIFEKEELKSREWHFNTANRILEKLRELHKEEITFVLIEQLSKKMSFVKSEDHINIIKEIVLKNYPHLKQ